MYTTLVSAVAIVTLFASTAAFAQQPPAGHPQDPSQPPSQSQPAAPGRGGMGGMHPGGMGGMQGGGMCGMMGGMGPMMGAASDPKALGRMLQLRGEIMKAVGEVLIKHGQALEAAPAR
jgi:hypothetical protein